MSSSKMIITIAGATGKMGGAIAKHLLKVPDIQIHALCRNPSKLPSLLAENPSVTVFQADVADTEGIRKSLRSASVAICCYYGDFDFMADSQKTLIDACIAEQVPRYIPSDWTLDWRPLSLGDIPAKDPMIKIARYLDERSDKIKAVHILNGVFIEAPWRSIWDAKNKTFMYWGTGEEKWDFTSYDNAAEFTAKVALDRNSVGYKCFRGDHISVKGIAAEYKAIYGEEPKLRQLGSLDDLYKTMHQIKEQNPTNIWSWLPMFYTYYTSNGQASIESLDNDQYPGVKLATIRDYFKSVPKEKLGQVEML